ncbi:MAG: non-lysosomal glucosylceramidase [Treponema sp.]|nr:non-lysosomal glucosylceramidase [Treponema sp.]
MKNLNEKASAARFLLGGIGTGNISLDQNARLCDIEIWSVPNKGFRSPYSFFAVRAEEPSGAVHAKALESWLQPPYKHPHGAPFRLMEGFSRFKHSQMSGDVSFVNYTLSDEGIPLTAELEAFSPFIPLNTDDSSLPAGVLRYSITNNAKAALKVSVAGSFCNLSGLTDKTTDWTHQIGFGPSKNSFVKSDTLQGIHFTPLEKPEDDLDYLEMALLTTEKEKVSYLDLWYQGAWLDGLQDFWNDFTSDGELSPGRTLDLIGNKDVNVTCPVGSVCIKKEIAPGEKKTFEFIITWYKPNRINSWHPNWYTRKGSTGSVKNYYTKFGKPLETAEYLVKNMERLEGDSRKFVKALNTGVLPEEVISALMATSTVIKSNTCFRVEDGTFFAWEGCNDTSGSCDGNCTHVWNYTQSLAFLFPDLERSMRRTEFLTETEEDGKQNFRARKYFNDPDHNMHPAADGQLGTVIRLYRDWKLCGDHAFITELWPQAKKALEYAFTYWDKDGDGVMEGQQHNTYDIEFYGVTSMLNSIFYAALRAGEEISLYLGDEASAQKYKALREKGKEKIDALCFNGEYYEQKLDDIQKYKYQFGSGCLSDQLLGQQLAHVSGLGYILDEKNVKTAVKSIFTHCFRENLEQYTNTQRTYALNDEGGLLLCSWPRGGRPEIPFVYSDEVWSGIEYQVASHLIYEGFVEEGLKIVAACRARHDGIKRSPWNEVECGHHYARSLASYGVLLALTGFRCDAQNKTLYFKPAIKEENFTGFFCCNDGWGLYHQKKGPDGLRGEIETFYGNLEDYKVLSC